VAKQFLNQGLLFGSPTGPTCDSIDIVYEHSDYELPPALTSGSFVNFLSASAYTASYASVEFNDFEPIQTYFI
jgi:ornithine decarboxylase